MLRSHKAESFVGIVVWVFILSFVVLWIVNILIFSSDTTTKYNETNRIQVLKQNLTNAIKQTNTSALRENEIFYLHKNRADGINGKYEIYTGATNENYKYVDELWNTIEDITTFSWDIYSQVLWVSNEDITLINQNQIIRASVKKLIRK